MRLRLAAAVSLILAAGSACSGNLDQRQVDAVEAALADSLARVTEATDVDLTLYEGVRASVVLSAPLAVTTERDNGDTQTLFQGGVTILLTDSTSAQTHASSDRVLYESPQAVFTLTGEVHVEGLKGRSLQADSLIWDRNTQRIRTNGYVVMVTEADSIYGYGLRATSDLADYTVLRITGTVSKRRTVREGADANP